MEGGGAFLDVQPDGQEVLTDKGSGLLVFV